MILADANNIRSNPHFGKFWESEHDKAAYSLPALHSLPWANLMGLNFLVL